MNLHQPRSILRRLGLVLGSVFLAAATAFAQAAGTGAVQGRVLNATNGSYLTNARVSVTGSNAQAFTDNSGQFRLDGLPAGPATLRVFYTGLAEKTLSVTIAAGQTATLDVNLNATDTKGEGEVVKLDAFTVASKREMDSAAIAINEQRFAMNIKNVVNTDAFGDIAEGNIGDFVKFLPGVTIDYVSPDARTISVRGVAANYTPITINGNPMASANSSSAGRTQELEQVSLNNASRVEVSKSRTPDVSANALGGSVNLVPRSAFEKSKPSLDYRVFLERERRREEPEQDPRPHQRGLPQGQARLRHGLHPPGDEELRLHPEHPRVEHLLPAAPRQPRLAPDHRRPGRLEPRAAHPRPVSGAGRPEEQPARIRRRDARLAFHAG
jgi:hypothetical protein